MNRLSKSESGVDLHRIDAKAKAINWLGPQKAAVLKLPFRLSEITYFDNNAVRDPFAASTSGYVATTGFFERIKPRLILENQMMLKKHGMLLSGGAPLYRRRAVLGFLRKGLGGVPKKNSLIFRIAEIHPNL